MTIQELEQKLNECQKELAELKESKKEGKWKPEKGEEFWYRTSNGETMWSSRGTADPFSEWKINNLPIFKTNEDCKRYWHFMDTVKEKSYEFSKEEWEDSSIEKHFICRDYDEYDEEEEVFVVLADEFYKHCGSIYFKTREDAQYIIDNFKDELMEYWI